jgi:hypothetical protein
MKHPLFLALLLVAAVHATARPVEFGCAQKQITVSEAAGTVALEALRDGGFDEPATAVFNLYPDRPSIPRVTYAVAFPAGSARATVLMPTGNDGYYSGSRRYGVTCQGYSGTVPPAEPGPGGYMSLDIFEDESFPTISISPVTVVEGDPAIVDITLTPPFGAVPDLNFDLTDGTAEAGKDYTRSGSSLSIGAFASTGRLTIPTIEDTQAEADEVLHVQFRGGGSVREKFIVTIADDDRPPYALTLDRASYDFVEGSANAVTVTRSGQTSGAAAATLHVVTPTPAQWFADVPVGFAAGETSKRVQLPFDDAWFTNYRSGTLQLITAGYVAASATVSMTDDDTTPAVSIVGAEVLEGAAGQTTRVDVTVTLSAPLGVDFYVDVVTTDGTATSADYVPLSKRVFIAPSALSQKVSVEVRGDNALEADETFHVELTNCCSSLALIGERTATVVIRNDDDGSGDESPTTYAFERPLPAGWYESQKWLTATIVRGGGTSRASAAQVKLTAGPARKFAPLEVRFRANETRKSVRFYIDDWFYSDDAPGVLELFDGTRSVDRMAGVIWEDEPKPVIKVADLDVTEGSATRRVGFQVTITPPSFYAIETKVLLSEVYTWLGHDFSGLAQGQPWTIPALRSSATIGFDLVADNDREADETFRAELLVLPPSGAITEGGSALCTIHDEDTARAGLTVPDALARGAKATITLTFTYSAPYDESLEVSTSTPDLLEVPERLSVRGGAVKATFEVTALRSGNAVVTVRLPRRLDDLKLTQPLLIYHLTTPILPELVRVPVGGTAAVKLTLSSPAEEEVRVAVSSADRTIAAAEPSTMLAPDGGTLTVYGTSIGRTTLAITLPAELGGTTAQLPVEVFEPVPGRTRATRH